MKHFEEDSYPFYIIISINPRNEIIVICVPCVVGSMPGQVLQPDMISIAQATNFRKSISNSGAPNHLPFMCTCFMLLLL